jgi:hypothetical protein
MARSMPESHARTGSSTNIHCPGPTVLPDHLRRASSRHVGRPGPVPGNLSLWSMVMGRPAHLLPRMLLIKGWSFCSLHEILGASHLNCCQVSWIALNSASRAQTNPGDPDQEYHPPLHGFRATFALRSRPSSKILGVARC